MKWTLNKCNWFSQPSSDRGTIVERVHVGEGGLIQYQAGLAFCVMLAKILV